jgi:ABC-type nitrate/sulfonate/bicarbonate transport system substrate-binding protein
MAGKFTFRIIFFSLLSMIMLAANVEAGRVRVAIPSTTHAVLAFSTSRDKGYYRDEGLDVELILMSAPIASRALLSGDVEVATVGGAGLPPVLSGAPLRFIFTTYNRPMFWLFGKAEIRSVKELGKEGGGKRHRQRSRLSAA